MKLIIIIFAAAWIIYKLRLMRYFLRRCEYDGPPVAFNAEIKAEQKKAARLHRQATKSSGPLIINTAPTLAEWEAEQKERQQAREKLEIQAAYIVGQQGHNPASVKYMSVALMEALIRDYIKATKE